MKILQLIDSLEPGGAERMAVNYANALADKIEFSAIVSTRKEGALKNQIASEVSYLFLNRKKIIDITAVFRLKKFVKTNGIQILHAHGTSFFLAVLVKMIVPSLKIIWHDHYGNRDTQQRKENKMLVLCSYFFKSSVAVNSKLKNWHKKNLHVSNIIYLPNFTTRRSGAVITKLLGDEGKRIICLSNLRHPKNHKMLIEAFYQSSLWEQGWTLHLVGKDYRDAYSDDIKSLISDCRLESFIYLYGSVQDIFNVLEQSDVAVLASKFEGFPVTLLEYGLASLPVIATDVGNSSEIILDGKSGFLVNPDNFQEMQTCLQKLCGNQSLRSNFANELNQFVKANFSEEIVVSKVIEHYKSLL